MMTQTRCSDRIYPVLTAPEVYTQNLSGHRYFVELISRDCELQEDRAVPEYTRTIDVVVTQPSKEAIAQLVSACGWLKGYSVVSYNELSFQEAPF